MPQNIEARDIFKSLQDIEMKQLLSYSKEGVLPLVPIPRNWIGRTVDDLTTVVPAFCRREAERFVAAYRRTLNDLNIGAAPADPERRKAFDGHTTGEMLGIVFNTVEGTWHLPRTKAVSFLNLLHKASTSESLSLHEVKGVHPNTPNTHYS